MSPQTMRPRASPLLLPHHLALLGYRVWAREGPKRVWQPLVIVLEVFPLLLLPPLPREEVKTRKGLKRVLLVIFPPVLLVLPVWLLFLESKAMNLFQIIIMALSILSLNCNGLRDQSKRGGHIQWLRNLPVSMSFASRKPIVSWLLKVPRGSSLPVLVLLCLLGLAILVAVLFCSVPR